MIVRLKHHRDTLIQGEVTDDDELILANYITYNGETYCYSGMKAGVTTFTRIPKPIDITGLIK